jgi:cytidylate kinase
VRKFNKLIIACDGESASGKSTAAKLISIKYKLLLINSGLLYRYGSKLIIRDKPKNIVNFLKNKFKNVSYKTIAKQNLHSEEISNHVAILAKNKKVREIVNKFQKKLIKTNKKICVEGRDIASKILTKNPKYDLAFYFKCNVKVASYRRWLDIKKKVPLKDVRSSLKKRTQMDKKRKNSPLIRVKDAILIRTDILNKKQVLSKMSKSIDRLT